MRTALLAILLAITATTLAAAPCSAPEHRQFDFWIGEWNVYTPAGKLAGENSIVREHGGCVLRETWRGAGGMTGTSLNLYDAARKVWHQSWADSNGTLLQIDGHLTGTSMRMENASQRITWTPAEDGSVRQVWEQKDGEGWRVVFDGRYVRK